MTAKRDRRKMANRQRALVAKLVKVVGQHGLPSWATKKPPRNLKAKDRVKRTIRKPKL